jgi:dTDP-4-amino-4,6-dideoxygalactose transaminase
MLGRFEKEFSAYVGARHAVAVASGTAALHLAFHCAGIGQDDVVVVPTFSFIGGIAPIHYVGATPIFVDCDPRSWCFDSALLGEALARAAKLGRRAAAISPADLFGHACDARALAPVAAKLGIPLILDSAEGVGALVDGGHPVRFAQCAAFSFNGNKLITTSGGGMLASDDGELIARARYLSTTARVPVAHYEHTEVGFNYRLSNLSAAVGIGQLEGVEARIARRREIFNQYQQELGNLPGIEFPQELPGYRHSRWLSTVTCDPGRFGMVPEQIRLFLEEFNIESRRVWKPMHLQPVFTDAICIGGEQAVRIYEDGLCLPSGSGMLDKDVRRVIDAVIAAHRSVRPRVAVAGNV